MGVPGTLLRLPFVNHFRSAIPDGSQWMPFGLESRGTGVPSHNFDFGRRIGFDVLKDVHCGVHGDIDDDVHGDVLRDVHGNVHRARRAQVLQRIDATDLFTIDNCYQ